MSSINLRPAHPRDKPAITALAAKIWEGEDYLHRNFDDWVAQERGRFTVAYAQDALVGCGKLTEFRPGEWWLEGLRVDPDWRGQGIAHLLHHSAIQFVDETAAEEKLTGSLRFATESQNYPVHKLALDTGFTHISSHLLYYAAVPAANHPDPLPFTPIHPSEKLQVESWFKSSLHFAACNGLFEDNWKWYEIMPRLDTLLQDGRLHWWHKAPSQPQGLVIIHHRDPQTLVLNYVDTPDNRWAELFEDVTRLAQSYHVHQVKSKPLATEKIRQALLQTTWQKDYDLEMWLFQRPIG